MIPQRNLSLLSNRLAQTGWRRIPEAILERDYCLSWFLVGLSKTSLKDIFAFKGGTAIKKCYAPITAFLKTSISLCVNRFRSKQSRSTSMTSLGSQKRNRELAFASVTMTDIPTETATHSILDTMVPLPGTTGKEVKVDITINEKIVFPINSMPVLKAYDEYQDLPESAIIGVYSQNEIVTEKIVALFDPARNEPRDLYDLWYLTINDHVDLIDLKEAVKLKTGFRWKIRSKPAPHSAGSLYHRPAG
jgi:predicted nucleotidyltransferase component of viral defense system